MRQIRLIEKDPRKANILIWLMNWKIKSNRMKPLLLTFLWVF